MISDVADTLKKVSALAGELAAEYETPAPDLMRKSEVRRQLRVQMSHLETSWLAHFGEPT